jgi:hypothetical protein
VDYYPDQPPGGGLAGYFTSTLESSSFISRRGRPPVIRAAEKVRTGPKLHREEPDLMSKTISLPIKTTIFSSFSMMLLFFTHKCCQYFPTYTSFFNFCFYFMFHFFSCPSQTASLGVFLSLAKGGGEYFQIIFNPAIKSEDRN